MRHRHLNHQRLSLAAIDDVIRRGRWQDWVGLRHEVLEDQSVLEKVEQFVARTWPSPTRNAIISG
jgi:hypothetical protein